jgi:hypothetical protein
MSILDTDMIAEIADQLIETAGFSTALWSVAEVVRACNQRQDRFLKETQLLISTATLGWTPAQPEHDLPPDWVETMVASWHDSATDAWHPLPAADAFELDHMTPDTALTVQTPQGYRASDLRTLRMVVGPPPTAPGEVELLYVALSERLTGLGIAFETPDEFVPYLKYGVLADLLGKDGRGQDLLRARYCEQRFDEGVALAQAIVDGWA